VVPIVGAVPGAAQADRGPAAAASHAARDKQPCRDEQCDRQHEEQKQRSEQSAERARLVAGELDAMCLQVADQ
jgi:hypothetical protein